MLNRSALNRSAFNATVTTVALLASASFSADATVTAESTRYKAATATISCGVQAIFGGEREQFAFWSGSAGVTPVLEAMRNLGASASWNAGASFTGFIERQVWSSVGFDVLSTLELLAGVTLADGAWVADAQTELSGVKIGKLSGQWTASGTFLAEGTRTRLSNAVWTQETASWVEPTVTIGGISYHDGFTFHKGTAVWDNVPYLTATFINGMFYQSVAVCVGNAKLIGCGKGDWSASVVFNIPPTKIHPAKCDFTQGAVLVVDPLYQGEAGAYFESGAQWSIKARVQHSARQQLSAGSSLTAQAVKKGILKAAFTNTSVLTQSGLRIAGTPVPLTCSATLTSNSQRIRLASATWEGMGSVMAAAAVLTTAPAPKQRTYIVTGMNRVFVLPGTTSFSG